MRACGALLALALGASPLAAQTANRPTGQPVVVTAQEKRWQADRLLDQGRNEEARDAYLAIYADFAKDPEFNRDLGYAFYRSKPPDIPKAIQYWTVSWQLDGKEELKIEAARAYGVSGSGHAARGCLLDLAAAHPQHPQHWKEAAEIAEVAQQLPQAETWYRTYSPPARRRSRPVSLGRIPVVDEAVPGSHRRVQQGPGLSPRNTPAASASPRFSRTRAISGRVSAVTTKC